MKTLSYLPTNSQLRAAPSFTDKTKLLWNLSLLFLCYPIYRMPSVAGIGLVLYRLTRPYRLVWNHVTYVLPGSCPPEIAKMKGDYEPEVTKIIKSFHEGTFIDGGAGIGLYSLMMEDSVDVFAFEPDPRFYQSIESSLKASHRSNVTVIAAAIWKERCILRLHTHPFARFSSSVKEGSIPQQFSDNSQSVPGFPLDDLKIIRYPVLLKLDLEGSEPEAMVGGIRMLLRKDATLIFEALDEDALQRCKRIIQPLGYEVRRLSDKEYLGRRSA